MTYHLVFRIRGMYLRDIIDGKKTREVRRASPFWRMRALHAGDALVRREDVVAVFISGFIVHRRRVERVDWEWNVEDALGREPTMQGERDLGTGPVWVFHLGEVMT